MVNVSSDNQHRARILADTQIPNLISSWSELPGVYQDIDHWDGLEAASYIEEWPLYEMYRHQLEDASQRGWLTSEQEQEMKKLRSLVREHEHKLRQLLG